MNDRHIYTGDTEISVLMDELRAFAFVRDWEKFHSPKNLATSISIESGELLQNFQWREVPNRDIAPELADIFIYMLYLADTMGIDLVAATWDKIYSNGQRYPVEKCKGNCKKAEEL
jgi:NTP pyrophosphatase (non-canonical NTP hydrolase)